MKKFLTTFVITNLLALVLMPLTNITLAEEYNAQKGIDELCKDPSTCPITKPEQIFTILAKVLQYTYTIFFIVAVIFILIGAFNFLTAQGDPEKIKGARSQITWAVVAIAIALLSVGAAAIIQNFLGNNT